MANIKNILEPTYAKKSVTIDSESPKIMRLKKKCEEHGLNIIRDFEGVLRVCLKKQARKGADREIKNEFFLYKE